MISFATKNKDDPSDEDSAASPNLPNSPNFNQIIVMFM